ncbi:MAG: DUF2341 domain-containing protein [Patescibacteria group bacterium]|nr:DUF2341 domain-containing protein [Patescibacteria group bacterium]
MRYSKSSIVFILTTALFLIGAVCFLFYSPLTKAAETNEIKISPTAFSGSPSTPLGAGWQNPQAVLTQDLSQNAAFEEFNQENSAYPAPVQTGNSKLETRNSKQILNFLNSKFHILYSLFFKDSVAQAEEITTENSTSTPLDINNQTEPTPEIEPIIETPAMEPLISEPLIETPEQPQIVEKILEISNFSVSDSFKEKQIENVQLRFSLAAKTGETDTKEEHETDTKFLIEYQNNKDWQEVGEISFNNEISNATNGGYWLYALPVFQSWQDLDNLKIRFVYQETVSSQFSDTNQVSHSLVYLDAAWLEITTAEQPEKILEQQEPIKEIKSFKNNEEPTFELTESFFAKIKNFFKKEKKDFVLIDPMGKESKDGLINQGNKVKVSRSGDKRSFRPGLYKLKIKQGDKETIQEFTWGVLTLNTNKSVYLSAEALSKAGLPNETAYLQMAVLKDDGHTVCDASLKLEIKNSKSETIVLSTGDGTIQYSGQCGPDNVIDVPDYFAYYPVGEAGTYVTTLTNLDNGYEITDSFEVRDSAPFEVERIGPTRIYPLANYEMKLKIKANQDFNGEIIEKIPDSFQIINSESEIRDSNDPNTKEIVWNADWKAGENYELKYQFDAPDVSPYIFLSGPLKIGQFEETRNWQVASDTPNGTGMLVYDEDGANSPSPHYRTWSGTDFSSESNLLADETVTDEVNHTIIEACPTRDEYIRGALTTAGHLDVQVWDVNTTAWINGGSAPTNGDFTTGIGTTNDVYRAFDVAYESTSGDGLVVYESTSGTNKTIMYRTWDGSNWSSEQTLDYSSVAEGGSNDVAVWVELEADYATNNILLAWQDKTGKGYYGARWDGTQWLNIALIDGAGVNAARQDFDIAWEGTSHNGKIVYAKSTIDLGASTYTPGSGWASDTISDVGIDQAVQWIRIAGSPNNNYIAAIYSFLQSAYSGEITVDMWNGTNWTSVSTPTKDSDVNNNGYAQGMDVAWEQGSGADRALFVWRDGPTDEYSLRYMVYDISDGVFEAIDDDSVCNLTGTNTNQTVTSLANAENSSGPCTGLGAWEDEINGIKLTSDTGSRKIMVLAEDKTAALKPEAQLWNGTDTGTWLTQTSNMGTFETDLSTGATLSASLPTKAYDFAFMKYSAAAANLTQIHYHWRNDDGSESAATSATGSTEDTTLGCLPESTTKRIRVEVSNEGSATSDAITYRLEYGAKATTCAAISSWTDVGAADGDWDISNSSNLTDGNDTTDVANLANGKVTNENTTFETPNAAQKDTSSTTAGITLAATDFAEIEYSIQALAAATDGGTYCFRLTNAGSTTNFTYTTYPEATVYSSPTIEQIHYHWRNDDGSESAATSATASTEDTVLSSLVKNTTTRIRLEASNEGTCSSAAITYRLEYGAKSTTCGAIVSWTDVGAADGDWDMSNSSNLTDGNDTTNVANLANGKVTDENTTFKTTNAAQKDTSSTTAGITLASTEFAEIEYSIKALTAATAGGTYCFRLTNAGTATNFTYTKYAEATIYTPPAVDETHFRWRNDDGGENGSWTVDGLTYTTRRMLTIDNSKITSDLVDLPVRVSLASFPDIDLADFNANGYDIRFTQFDGTTLLKYERESFNQTADTGEFWVKIPNARTAISNDNRFFIYYRTTDTTDGEDATNVWDSDFESVHHLNIASQGTVVSADTTHVSDTFSRTLVRTDDDNQTLHLFYAKAGTSDRTLWWKISTDNGFTWTSETQIGSTAGRGNLPTVEVDSNGKDIHLVYSNSNDLKHWMFYRKLTWNGASWDVGSEETIHEGATGTSGVSDASMAIDSSGVVHVVWAFWDNSTTYNAYYENNSAGNWSASPTTLGTDNAWVMPVIQVDSSRNLHVVVALNGLVEYQKATYSAGPTWTWAGSWTAISGGTYSDVWSHVISSIDASNRLHVAWGGYGPTYRPLKYARKNANDTWESTVTLDAGNNHCYASIVAFGDTVYVTAMYNSSTGQTVYYKSTDAGANFGSRMAISDNTSTNLAFRSRISKYAIKPVLEGAWRTGSSSPYSMKYILIDELDSTTHNIDGGCINGVTGGAVGQINGADSFDGSNDYIDIGTGPSTVKTVSFWIYPETTTEYFINLTSTTKYIWVSGGTVTVTGFTGTPTIYVNGVVTSTLAADAWQYVTVTTGTAENASNFDIGRTADTNYLEGKIDEVRISQTARSADWITADYNSTNNSLLTYGSEETGSGTAATWKAAEDTTASQPLSTNVRLRFSFKNTTATASGYNYRLQYAAQTGGSCGDETYTDVPVAGSCGSEAACMSASTYFVDQAATTRQLSIPSNYAFVAGKIIENASNQTDDITLTASQFTEAEYSFQFTVNASDSTVYCFKARNNTTELDSYTKIADITAGGGQAPTVSDVQLNGQVAIDLIESTTKSVSATADVSDPDGCDTITGVTAKIYRSGVTSAQACSANDNNCYSVASCTETSCSGTDAVYTCTISMQFFADPTDTGTPWVSQYWRAYVTATDEDDATASGYSAADAPDVNSLLGLDVTATINYGSLGAGAKNDPLDKTTTVTATGNVSLDVTLYGVNMTSGGNNIAVGKQKYALATSTAYASGTSLLVDPGATAQLNCCKTFSSGSKATKDIWWGLEVPSPQAVGTYTGSITFSAAKNGWSVSGDWCE